MTNSAEEIGIIETILEQCRTGGTDLLPDTMQISTSHYAGEDRLQEEIQTLFRKFPIIIGHVSQLQEPGQFITHDATGVPILVTRTRDGHINGFLNVCRHRGARIENESCGKSTTFSCPYHGWTYDSHGRLRGLRKPDGFGEFEKSEYGLIPVPVFEKFGLIWVRPSPSRQAASEGNVIASNSEDQPIDIDAWLAPMAEQLGSLDLADHVIYKAWSVDCDMNWHIALEGFQETYHFCSAHKHTACSAYLDTQCVHLDLYPHVRNAVPLSNIGKLADVPREEWSYRKHFMTQNYLFPCNFVQVMTDHVYIHTITPRGTGGCTFHCMMLIPEPPATEKAEKYWQANYDVVRTVFNEDFTIGEGIQAGLSSGANEFFTIGRYENCIQLGRKAMDDALAGRLRA